MAMGGARVRAEAWTQPTCCGPACIGPGAAESFEYLWAHERAVHGSHAQIPSRSQACSQHQATAPTVGPVGIVDDFGWKAFSNGKGLQCSFDGPLVGTRDHQRRRIFQSQTSAQEVGDGGLAAQFGQSLVLPQAC